MSWAEVPAGLKHRNKGSVALRGEDDGNSVAAGDDARGGAGVAVRGGSVVGSTFFKRGGRGSVDVVVPEAEVGPAGSGVGGVGGGPVEGNHSERKSNRSRIIRKTASAEVYAFNHPDEAEGDGNDK